MKNPLKFWLIALSLFCIFPIWSQEEDEKVNPLTEDRFLIEGGLFFVNRNFRLGADAESDNGEIDFSEAFDLTENEPTYFFQFTWRFSRNKKWSASIASFGVSAGNSLTLDKDIVFEDITFEKGSFVEGGVSFQLYRLFFDYSILTKPKHRLGVGLGVHGMNIEAFVEGEIRTSEGNLEPETRRVNGLIPLPNIGASYMYTPHPKWMLGASVDWFGLTVDQYSGGLWNIAPRAKFQIIEHFGVGLDYRFFLLNAKVSGENWNGGFDMTFQGPLISLHGNF